MKAIDLVNRHRFIERGSRVRINVPGDHYGRTVDVVGKIDDKVYVELWPGENELFHASEVVPVG